MYRRTASSAAADSLTKADDSLARHRALLRLGRDDHGFHAPFVDQAGWESHIARVPCARRLFP